MSKLRCVQGTAPVTNGTVDFTVSGLGASETMKGVLFWWSNTESGDVPPVDHAMLGWGFADFDQNNGEVCGCYADEHDTGNSVCRTTESNIDCIRIINPDTQNLDVVGTVSGTGNGPITDGVRVEFTTTTTGEDYLINAILIQGSDAEAACGTHVLPSGTTANTIDPGFSGPADLIFILGAKKANPGFDETISSTGQLQLGCAIRTHSDGGGIKNQCVETVHQNNVTTARPAGRHSTDACTSNLQIDGSGHFQRCFVSDFEAATSGREIEFTGRVGGGGVYGIAYLALKLPNHELFLSEKQTPSSTGAEAIQFPGMDKAPQFCMFVGQRHSAVNVDDTTFEAGPFGVGACDAATELTASFAREDTATTMNTQSTTTSDHCFEVPMDTGATSNDESATLTSFATYTNGGEVNVNWDQVDTTSNRYYWALAIDEEDAGQTVTPGRISNGQVYAPEVLQLVEPGLIDNGAVYAPALGEIVEPGLINNGTVHAPTLLLTVEPGLISRGMVHAVTQEDFSFFDHMTELGTMQWNEVGAGVFGFTDSYADINGGANTAHYLRHLFGLDTTKTFTWFVKLRGVATSAQDDVITIWSDSGGAQEGTTAGLASQRRLAIDLVNGGIRLKHFNNIGSAQYWNNGTQTWQSGAIAANTMLNGEDADWYGVVFEYDQPNSQIRLMIVGENSGTESDMQQGYRIIARTAWVATSVFASWDDLWFTIGNRYTDGAAFDFHVEWVKYTLDTTLNGWTNNRQDGTGTPDEYLLHRDVIYNPDDPLVLTAGDIAYTEEAWEAGAQGRRAHTILNDGTSLRLFYESFDDAGASFDTAIGVATASVEAGPWTGAGTENPIINPEVDIGTGYSSVRCNRAIFNAETQEYWIYVGAEISNVFRIFLFKSSNFDGPYTMFSGSGTDGSVLDEITPSSTPGTPQHGEDGFSDPYVFYDNDAREWVMYCSGYRSRPAGNPSTWAVDPRAGWAVFRATSLDGETWTLQNGSLPIIVADEEKLRSFTGAPSNNSFPVSDHTALNADEPIVLRSSGSIATVFPTRIRKFPDASTIEVYNRSGAWGTGWLMASAIAGSITPSTIYEHSDGTFRMIVTAFQPFINGIGTQIGDYEHSFTYTASSKNTDTWTPDYTAGDPVLSFWQDEQASKENFATVNGVDDPRLPAGYINNGQVYAPQVFQLVEPGSINNGQVYSPQALQVAEPGLINQGQVYAPTLQVDQTITPGRIANGQVHSPGALQLVEPGQVEQGAVYGLEALQLVSPGLIDLGVVYEATVGGPQNVAVGRVANGAVYAPTVVLGDAAPVNLIGKPSSISLEGKPA